MTAWLDHRVLVCVGTGGVGKTTVAAALGVAAARAGKRALVITIDPARRLADALGAGTLGHEATQIPREILARAGVPESGALSALMLDTKRTFDEVVARYAPDPESHERILANPIYRNLTDALAGSREYSAMEKLHQIHAQGQYDLIVLDTPPARHALDFLDAPRRLTSLLDSQLLRLLFRPALAMGSTGLRLFRLGSATVLRAIERVSGLEFLTAVSEFLLAFEGMLDGFHARARETDALLRSPQCGFLLVSGPDSGQVQRAEAFHRRLARERVRLVGLIVNRVHAWPGQGPPPRLDPEAITLEAEWLAKALAERAALADPAATARGLVEIAARQAALAARDTAAAERLAGSLPLSSEQVRVIHLFDEDVRAIDGVARICDALFAEASHG